VLAWSGAPLWAILLLGILGVTWQFVLLRGHYAQRLAAQAG
jgi:hypothetical protein